MSNNQLSTAFAQSSAKDREKEKAFDILDRERAIESLSLDLPASRQHVGVCRTRDNFLAKIPLEDLKRQKLTKEELKDVELARQRAQDRIRHRRNRRINALIKKGLLPDEARHFTPERKDNLLSTFTASVSQYSKD